MAGWLRLDKVSIGGHKLVTDYHIVWFAVVLWVNCLNLTIQEFASGRLVRQGFVSLHTGGVTGSIPVAPTICSSLPISHWRAACRRRVCVWHVFAKKTLILDPVLISMDHRPSLPPDVPRRMS